MWGREIILPAHGLATVWIRRLRVKVSLTVFFFAFQVDVGREVGIFGAMWDAVVTGGK